MRLFEVIYAGADLLVVNKPADLVCHPTKGDRYSSLISRVRLCLGRTEDPRLVNRLDRETSGVTLVARNTRVAGELGRLWERRDVEKTYLAVVAGHVAQDEGLIDAPLGRDEHSPVAIKDCVRADGISAKTRFRVLRRFEKPVPPAEKGGVPVNRQFSVLELTPLTGRKHQIRIHLAHLGHPIVGDKLYGPDEDCYLALVQRRLTPAQRATLVLPYHALHASQVRFHWRGRDWHFTAEPEEWLVPWLS